SIAASLGDCVVDCTGDTEEGVKICLKAMESHVDIVSLNVEMDATVGPYLKLLADEAGVVYSGTAGDEPGAIMELYEFAKFSGLEVLVLGKGKNNQLNNYVTRAELEEEAHLKNLNSKMLTSFVDGTNTMVELNSVCNATGFVPDVRGCHYFKTDARHLAKDIDLIERGSKLKSYGVVDFAAGVAPGVFAIVRAKHDIIDSEMKFLSMGEGPNYALYRPYHLTSIETPLSIARAVLLREATISPMGRPVAETITIAKRDLKAGEYIEGIGSDDIFGSLEKSEIQRAEDLLPVGLVVGKTKMLKDVRKGTPIKYEDVCLDENSEIVKIRNLQDKFWVD
ncbi:MAG: NAD(P)-dependent oxidoreductase, partial [Peptoniphilus sp.]|nr:NAD(P)-dependent oxidoreductase [Peptoniphilus sp.]